MYLFLAEQTQQYPVSTMCQVLLSYLSRRLWQPGMDPRAAEPGDSLLAGTHSPFHAGDGAVCQSERNKPIGTKLRAGVRAAPNLLNREFTATSANTRVSKRYHLG